MDWHLGRSKAFRPPTNCASTLQHFAPSLKQDSIESLRRGQTCSGTHCGLCRACKFQGPFDRVVPEQVNQYTPKDKITNSLTNPPRPKNLKRLVILWVILLISSFREKILLPGARLEEFQFASAAISLVPEIGVE